MQSVHKIILKSSKNKRKKYFDVLSKKEVSSLPKTDRLIISILDKDIDIEDIYNIIDNITIYLTCDIGLTTKGFSILYDENNIHPDRYTNFF